MSGHIFSDPDFGMNLREMPGVSYPSGYNFSKIPMPSGSPFRVSWWYRRVFATPSDARRQWLHLDGINFRANVWVNGKEVADSQKVVSEVAAPLKEVTLTVSAELENSSSTEVSGDLKGKIGASAFSKHWTLAANERKTIAFDPLNLNNPRLRWPVNLGDPNLYSLKMEVDVSGQVSDASESAFGIGRSPANCSMTNRCSK